MEMWWVTSRSGVIQGLKGIGLWSPGIENIENAVAKSLYDII